MAVQSVLDKLAIEYHTIELGSVKLKQTLSSDQLTKFNSGLQHYQLELMEDKKKILVERIKVSLVELFNSSDYEMRLKLSEYLSKRLNYDYTYLSNIFSEMEGSTLERYYIVRRIERVKELIVYDGLSITEIAYQLNYSNVSHLCVQFKKVSGQTPSTFKKLWENGEFVWRTCE